MKILVCHNNYAEYGGEAKAVAEDIEILRAAGHEVEVLSADSGEIRTYNLIRKLLLFPKAVFNFRSYREARQLVRRFKPDIAHIHNVFPLLSPSIYWAMAKSRVPMVQTIHNYRFLCPNGLFYTHGSICERCKKGNYWHAVRFKCYRGSSALSALYAASIWLHRKLGIMNKISAYLFLSEFTRNKFIEAGFPPEKLFVRKPKWKSAKAATGSSGTYALYIGRLSREKGVTTLVKSFLGNRRLPLKIAGGGPLSDELKKEVAEQGGANIEFVGFVKGAEKESMLRNSRFLVIPSECYEHRPTAILEAYSAGKPVIGARIGAVKEMIDEGVTGLFFESGSEAELMSKTSFLFDNPEVVKMMASNLRDLDRWFNTDYPYFCDLDSLYTSLAMQRPRQYPTGGAVRLQRPINPICELSNERDEDNRRGDV